MRGVLFSLALTALCLLGGSARAEEGSYLYQPAFSIDHVLREPAGACMPQPGDIMLRLDRSVFWRVTHYMAMAFDPNGSGIVFARPDGTLAILEAGPCDTQWVRTLPLVEHLKEYEAIGRVWIRRRKVPLTKEQSCRLTQFALAQDGKRFAIIRLAGQLTPFRHRGPIRTEYVGKPVGDRKSYFCSELVCESCVAAGLLDPARTRPSATYPHDLFFGRSCNPFIDRHLDVNCFWHPPARWVSCLPTVVPPGAKP